MAGSTRMYTSGWPKNQKRCCQRSGSPPPDGSNQWVPIVRSKSSMAHADVSTGSASRSRIAVMNRDQTTSGSRNSVMPGARMFTTVVM